MAPPGGTPLGATPGALGLTVGSPVPPQSWASCESSCFWWLLMIADLPQISYPAKSSSTRPSVTSTSPVARSTVRTGIRRRGGAGSGDWSVGRTIVWSLPGVLLSSFHPFGVLQCGRALVGGQGHAVLALHLPAQPEGGDGVAERQDTGCGVEGLLHAVLVTDRRD